MDTGLFSPTLETAMLKIFYHLDRNFHKLANGARIKTLKSHKQPQILVRSLARSQDMWHRIVLGLTLRQCRKTSE